MITEILNSAIYQSETNFNFYVNRIELSSLAMDIFIQETKNIMSNHKIDIQKIYEYKGREVVLDNSKDGIYVNILFTEIIRNRDFDSTPF